MTVPTPIVEWAPDKGPYELVDTYANLTGASGAYVSTPDSAAVSITGDIEIVVRVMLTDWTPSATNAMVGKFAAGSRDYWFEIRTDGKVKFGWSSDGATLLEAVSTVATGFSDGLTYWLKVTRNSSTGTVTFSYASDFPNEPTSWTGLGASVATAPSAMNNGTSPLWLGGLSGGTSWLSGRVYQATIRNGINGTTVAEFHADRDSIPGSSTFVSLTTGETWTFNGAASRVSEWADITDYVQEGSVQTGRQYEVDRFNAGTAALTLVATTRLFDPDNTSGTYYGKLVPMRQFRIRMTRSSTTYPVFRGYVTDWGQVVPAADRAVYTTVQLADAFSLLDATLAPSAYEAAVLADSPKIYYRFDDTNRLTDSSGREGHGVFSSTPTTVTGLLANDPSKAFASTATVYAQATIGVGIGATRFPRLEFWMQTTASTGVLFDTYYNSNEPLGTSDTRITVYLEAGELGYWTQADGAPGFGRTLNRITDVVVNDGIAHHVYLNFTDGSCQIDGTAVSNTDRGLTRPSQVGADPLTVEVLTVGNSLDRIYPYVGTIDELALSDATLTTHYMVGRTPWAGQTTGARVAAILDAIDWPAGLRDIDTGDSTMQAFDAAGQSALQAIQQAADTELGQTHVDAYGRVHHRARQALWLDGRSRNSQQTFGDVHSGEAVRYVAEGFSLTRDETLLRNPVSASRQGGTTITVADSAGITKYGNRAYAAPTSYDSSDNVINDRATFLLGRYKELTTRLEAMTVHVHANPSVLTPVVGRRQIGDRITVKRTPLGTGNEVVSELIIEGVAHRFAPEFWSTTYRASPVETTVFLILDDATYGQLDEEALAY